MTTHWYQGYDVSATSVAGRDVPLRWSSLSAEFQAANAAAAIWDRSYVGRIKAMGTDVLDLLNRLSTNKVDTLQTGQGTRTVLTTNKGRIIDQLTVLKMPDHVLLLTSPGAQQAVLIWLDTYTITEDATFADTSADTVQLTVSGPKAQQLIGAAFGQQANALAGVGVVVVKGIAGDTLIARTDSLAGPTYEVIIPADMASPVWERLTHLGKPIGALPAGEESLEAVRIAAGVPRFGLEIAEKYNPLEVGMNDSISWNKGCYIGQEVVARLRTYHKVQRYLVHLNVEGHELPLHGAKLLSDGKDAGSVTSAVQLPDKPGITALAYLHTAFVKQGAWLLVALLGGGVAKAHVTWAPDLPPEAITPAQLLALAQESEE